MIGRSRAKPMASAVLSGSVSWRGSIVGLLVDRCLIVCPAPAVAGAGVFLMMIALWFIGSVPIARALVDAVVGHVCAIRGRCCPCGSRSLVLNGSGPACRPAPRRERGGSRPCDSRLQVILRPNVDWPGGAAAPLLRRRAIARRGELRLSGALFFNSSRPEAACLLRALRVVAAGALEAYKPVLLAAFAALLGGSFSLWPASVCRLFSCCDWAVIAPVFCPWWALSHRTAMWFFDSS